MNWEEYKNKFNTITRSQNYKEGSIEKFLSYAKKLFDKGIPIIFDANHLSVLVGYNVNYLVSAAANPNKFYRNFLINKRNGEPRTISEPLPSLK